MIKLPQIFEDKLKQDTSHYYKGAVYTTCSNFDQIFSENQLYFFEEYTDHGIRHINSVLDACSKLITPDTYKLLSERDISILVLSVFLHDLGMHLQPLTFKKMVTGGYDDVLNKDFGDEKWSVLWENYLFEARKFNDQQRKNIFGDASVHITEPDLNNPDTLTGIHRKLIGEFIRRHHPRIAFEVAFKGLTAHDGTQIDFCADFDYKHKLLAGLLARSHGMHIRDTFSILTNHFVRAWKRPFDIHIIYLMAVLRLADYFQIDSKRVLKVPYLTKQFRSPVSFSEHKKHLQTKYVQQLDDDPETLYITAEPENSTYFLALEKLFNDIQKEVDNSWAVLGEIYGAKRYEEQPKLTYRRVRSNLDDKKVFEVKVPYVPEKIAFTVDKEIPKLLVGPLYNDDPSYGVRELLQNAVDACLEREFYAQRNGNAYESSISIKIEPLDDQYLFSIVDNGKGMTLDEIKNYFLKVGGSFRKSDKWQIDHIDVDGHSNVNKSGRFGIGVLAAYLLGTEIEVKTKSIFTSMGYSFKTTLDQEQIEIKKDYDVKEGTTICILISYRTYSYLQRNAYKTKKNDLDIDYWSNDEEKVWIGFNMWYILNSPKITYKMPNSIFKDTGYKKFLPGLNDNLNNHWSEINDENYKKILWSYSANFPKTVICNGFIIPEDYRLMNEGINLPTVLVFDFDAKFPLNLNRTSVYSHLPFSNKLEEDIYKDFIAKLLVKDVINPFYENYIKISIDFITHPFIQQSDRRTRFYRSIDYKFNLMYCKNGFVLNHPIFLKQLCGLIHLRVFQYRSRKFNKLEVRNIDTVSITGLESMSEIKESASDIGAYFIKKYIVLGWTDNFKLSVHKTNPTLFDFEKNSKDEFIERWKFPKDLSLICYKTSNTIYKPDLLGEVISDLLGDDLIIPYNIEDRKKKFPKAFKELEPYMRKYLEKK